MPECRVCGNGQRMTATKEEWPGLSFMVRVWKCPVCGLAKCVVYKEDFDEWDSLHQSSPKCTPSISNNLVDTTDNSYILDDDDDNSDS